MATVTRVNGAIAADQFQGRELRYIQLDGTGIGTGYTAVNSAYEKAIRALQTFMFVTIIFVPTANVGIIAVEASPTALLPDVATDQAALEVADGAQATAIAASGIGDLTLTYVSLAGATWA